MKYYIYIICIYIYIICIYIYIIYIYIDMIREFEWWFHGILNGGSFMEFHGIDPTW